MSEDHKDQIREFERFVNQVAADTEVLKVVVTALIAKLAHIFDTDLIDDLEAVSKRALELGTPEAQKEGQLAHRLLQLKISRTEDYFRSLRTLVRGQGDPPTQAQN